MKNGWYVLWTTPDSSLSVKVEDGKVTEGARITSKGHKNLAPYRRNNKFRNYGWEVAKDIPYETFCKGYSSGNYVLR